MPYVTSATAIKPPAPRAAEMRVPESRHGEYSIAAIEPRVLRITVSGFWIEAVMTDFARDCAVAVKALPCSARDHLLLCDISGAAIQSQPIFSAFLAMLVHGRVRPLRTAFVSTNPISRMQARRMMATRDGIALFDDEASALRWLTEDA